MLTFPNQIAPSLYISDLETAQSEDTSQFDAVVSVCQDECADNVSCDYYHFELADGSGDVRGHNPGEYSRDLLEEAIKRVLSLRVLRQTVLVHCHAGVSRSVTVATAALAILRGQSWDETFDEVRERHPIANPGYELRDDAQAIVDDHR